MLSFLLAAVTCNAHPQFTLIPKVTSERAARTGSNYEASASVGFLVRVVIPAKMPNDAALRNHARGHETIAERVARSSDGTVRAVGSSQSQAHARLKQTIARMQSDLLKELQREERVYDTVTENGSAQNQGPVYGFPGGPNATILCPR